MGQVLPPCPDLWDTLTAAHALIGRQVTRGSSCAFVFETARPRMEVRRLDGTRMGSHELGEGCGSGGRELTSCHSAQQS